MADVLHIDDPKASALAHELAARTGESVNEAVVHALERELTLKRNSSPKKKASKEELLKLIAEIRLLPILDPRTPNEIVGYDEDGLPS